MKKWIVFAVLVVGLSVLSSGAVRPGGAAAYGRAVHQHMTAYAWSVWWDAEILQMSPIWEGASHEDESDHVFDRSGFCVTINHFWDADSSDTDPGTYAVGCRNNKSAWVKAYKYWGMAVGEYHSGDKSDAFHYLGHVAHLLGDMSVPAHAHGDTHVSGDAYDDDFISGGDGWRLSDAELDALRDAGPLEIPAGLDESTALYYLFYTTNQVADFYASDDEPGDSDDRHWDLGWVDFGSLENVPECRDDTRLEDECDLNVIRRNSYFRAIRATAALYKLFAESVKAQTQLTVVIDEVNELECHDDNMPGDASKPDFFVEVLIGNAWFRNEGNQVVDTEHIYPGWAFAWGVPLTGTIPVVIKLWDEDEESTPGAGDDPSDIDPRVGGRDLDLTVDLDKFIAFEDGVVYGDGVLGNCGDSLTSWGTEDDRSQIWFHIIPPNEPPTAEAGPDQTVDEGDLVTLSGSFTDPNVEDWHTSLWHLESSTNGQAVPDATGKELHFRPIDDGVYTFRFTVTDNHGAQGSDTVVVTAENVPPVASIDSITDETGAEIGVDVPVALVGLDIDMAGSFTDVGTADTHTAEVSWGDGNTDADADFDAFSDCVGGVTGTLNATHIYADVGVYTITLNVTDDDGGVGTTTAQIEVVDAAGAIEKVVERLTPLADDPNIQAAIDKLQGEQDGDASNGAFDMLEQGNPNAALEKIKQALGYLEAAEAADPGLDLKYDKGLLGLAAKSVAVGAIAETEAVAFRPNDLWKIQQAKDLVAEGDTLLAAQDYVGAVDKYQQGVREVQGIG
jgi:hypothetical protein